MKPPSYITTAITQILLTGKPFGGIESYALFGSASIAERIARLRKEGFAFDNERVPLETVYRRLDEILGAHVPRPRYVVATEALTTQYRRNTAKETRNAPVLAPDENAARLEKRRPVRPVRH